MRGADEQPGSMFSYVSLEDRVPKDHPLRAVRQITDQALAQISPRFDALCVHFGRPSVASEKLLRALLLQVLYTIRERMLMERRPDILPARRRRFVAPAEEQRILAQCR